MNILKRVVDSEQRIVREHPRRWKREIVLTIVMVVLAPILFPIYLWIPFVTFNVLLVLVRVLIRHRLNGDEALE